MTTTSRPPETPAITQRPTVKSSQRVNEIDLLRFLAALTVVLFHFAFRGYAADDRSVMPYPLLAPIAKYGFLGVELFFMISGFVILMTAANGNLRTFTISRIVRLYPAFWACCTLTFVAIVLFGGNRFAATLPQYLVNMTMLSGFVGVPSIDGVYWSLFIELQFYAMVAAILLIGRIEQAQWFLILWLIATALLELFPVYPLRVLLITDYAVYFIAGAMAFLVWSRGVSRARIAVIMIALLMAIHQTLDGLAGFERHYNTTMNVFAVVAIITSYFAIMLLVATHRTGLIGRMRWMTIGALTYPLYLIHQNIGFMIFNAAYPAINAHVLFWGTVLLMLGIAYAVHVVIERRSSRELKQLLNRGLDASQAHLGRLRTSLILKRTPATISRDPGSRE